jgi:uncharacterized coiled-coil DUF342 family protein
MTAFQDLFDAALRLMGAVGAPALIIYFVRDRRRNAITNNKAEKRLPFEVRATAATTLDAEVAALTKSFELDRRTRTETIEALRKDLQEAREEIDKKDQKIEELKKKVRELQEKVDEMQRQMTSLQHEFDDLNRQLSAIQDGKVGEQGTLM